MDGWMGGWVDEWMGGWVDGWMGERKGEGKGGWAKGTSKTCEKHTRCRAGVSAGLTPTSRQRIRRGEIGER